MFLYILGPGNEKRTKACSLGYAISMTRAKPEGKNFTTLADHTATLLAFDYPSEMVRDSSRRQ